MIRSMFSSFKLFSLSVILIASTVASHAQSVTLDSVKRKFAAYREHHLQEKLFVHADQDFYLTGELMWLRVFAVDATLHRPSQVSKVAYVELLDKGNKPVVQTKLRLGSDGGDGSVFIPATLASGKYTLRVYTQWMRNFAPDYYFHKIVTVVNPFIKPETPVAKAAKKTTVEFFPEGGNLVAGIRSRIGFKVSTADPSSDLTGYIINANSDTVAHFRPFKFGLGSFDFTPVAGETYKAFVTGNNTNAVQVQLPKVSEDGFVLQLKDSTAELIQIRVKHRQTGNQSLSYATLFGHARQSVFVAEVKPVYPSEAVFTIAKSTIPEGISHFTIFDNDQQPVAERLYFKAPADPMKLNLSSETNSFTTRKKVTLNVASASASGGLAADVSLAVYKLDSLTTEEHDNILSYLYLESDLKGDIESASYYFSNAPDAAQAADNLMLTHGWRRFEWSSVLKRENKIKFIPEFRSHLVTGTVSKSDGTPASGILTYLSSPGKLVNVYGGRSDKNGVVHFELRDFWGSRQLIFQTNTNRDSTYRLSLNNPYSDDVSGVSAGDINLSSDIRAKLEARSLSMQVQDVYFRETTDKITAVKPDSTNFFGQPDETYYLDAYTRFPVMEEVMREYVPGVLVRKRRDGFHFLILDRINKGILPGDPLVLLDGMPVFDVDKIMAFDPLKIKKLEVVTRMFYTGSMTLAGVVSYSTYQGDLGGFQIDPRSVVINYEGLQLQRQFYSPDYSSQKLKNSRLPDQRALLHWVPSLKTNAQGKSTVEFFTSDNTGEYVVVAHGLSKDGKAGTGTYKFSVKRLDY
jgi:hypothetical protein